MKNVIKEFSWVLLGVLLGLVVSYRFTKQVLSGDTILDINVHDTYFIIDAFEGVLLSVFFFVFLVYIFRSFKLQFKSIVTLLVLIFSGIVPAPKLARGRPEPSLAYTLLFYRIFADCSNLNSHLLGLPYGKKEMLEYGIVHLRL